MSRKQSPKTSAREQAMRYFRNNRLDKACTLYRKICKQDRRDSEAWFYLGNISGRIGQPAEAEKCLRHVITLEPSHAPAHYCLGAALREQGRLEEAATSYRQALRINPGNAEGHHNLGVVLQELGRLEEAEASYRSALQLRPEYAVACRSLGVVLKDLEQYAEARASFERAIQLDPQYIEACLSLANLYEDLAEYDKAETIYRQAQRLNPWDADVLCNLARLFESQARYQEAANTLQEALVIQPDQAEANFRLALYRLRCGDFKRGWPGYEWRWKTERCESREFSWPQWDGGSLSGQTLLVYGEQGIGDEIMFVSCIPDLPGSGAKIVLDCDPRLVSLFQRSFPGIAVHGKNAIEGSSWLGEQERIDCQIPMGSLPMHLRPSLESFPRHTGYLHADSQIRQAWRERFDALGQGARIGLSWRGGNVLKERNRRSIPLQQWSPVLKVPGVHFISIQYGDHHDEIEEVSAELGVEIHTWPDMDPTVDLDGFAAMISELDLVIAVDNSTVHIAGALNVPVWGLLPYVPNWRWLLDASSSHWYPSLRLFRASVAGGWEETIAGVAVELRVSKDNQAM